MLQWVAQTMCQYKIGDTNDPKRPFPFYKNRLEETRIASFSICASSEMLSEQLNQRLFLPEQERFLFKPFSTQSIQGILLSLTRRSDEIELWVLCYEPKQNEEPIGLFPEATRRERLLSNHLSSDNTMPFLSSFSIQGQAIKFHQSSGLASPMPEFWAALQHFAEQGLDLSPYPFWRESGLCLYCFSAGPEAVFPELDPTQPLSIRLDFNPYSQQVFVDPPMCFLLGSEGLAERFTYLDPVSDKTRSFYLNGIERYDYWKELQERFDDETYWKRAAEQVGEETALKLRESYWENAERFCEKGMDLALLKYESEDNLQLNFYRTEFLDQIPVSSNSSCMLLLSPSKEERIGPHGMPCRYCNLEQIPKGCPDMWDIELLSWYLEFPGETIFL